MKHDEKQIKMCSARVSKKKNKQKIKLLQTVSTLVGSCEVTFAEIANIFISLHVIKTSIHNNLRASNDNACEKFHVHFPIFGKIRKKRKKTLGKSKSFSFSMANAWKLLCWSFGAFWVIGNGKNWIFNRNVMEMNKKCHD